VPDSTILVEEFIEGEMYTFDGYTDRYGTLMPCPLVKMATGYDQGERSFYSHYTYTPVDPGDREVGNAHKVAQDAVHAIGLSNTPIQFDLLHSKDGWKIIELGARLGASRRKQYWLTYNFDHGTNDVLLRLGYEPEIFYKSKGLCVNRKFYTQEDGVCDGVTGVEEIRTLPSCRTMHVKVVPGEEIWSHHNGGEFIARLSLFHQDPQQVWRDLSRAEQLFAIPFR
jgi:hypothetical protein